MSQRHHEPSAYLYVIPSHAAFHAASGMSRLRDALRRAFDGERFDEWEVLVPDPAHLGLLFEQVRLFDIPCTFDPGVPLHYSKAARTLVCWLRWLSEGYAGRHLIRMMYDGIPAPQEQIVDGVRGGRLQMASLLRRAGIGSGRERLLPAVDAYIDNMSSGTSPADGKAVSQAQANRNWLIDLLDATPSQDAEGLLSLHAIAEGAHRIVTTLCRDAYPGEELALARAAELMNSLREAEDRLLPARDAAKHIIALLRGTFVPMLLQAPGHDAIATTAPLPGHLHATLRPSGVRTTIRVDLDENADTRHGADGDPVRSRLLLADPLLGIGEPWLRRCAEEAQETVRAALRAWSPLLREGARAMEARGQKGFTEWDGNIGPGKLDGDASVYPDKALRCFERCPYAFFLEYILDAREPAPWEDPVGLSAESFTSPLPGGERARLRAALGRALQEGAFPHAAEENCIGCHFRDICLGMANAHVPEISALRDAMRILTDPENPLFVVAFLRGPLCGTDDRALLAYAQAGGLFAFNARAIAGTDARIADGLQYIKDTVRLVRSNPPGLVVASMIDRLALHAAIACGPRGWPGAAALQDLLEHVLALSVAGMSIPDIVEALDHSEVEH